VTGRGRAAVFGAQGQIGRELVRALAAAAYDVTAIVRAQCDVTDARAVDESLTGFGERDVVVNAAAWNDVVGAETKFADALIANGCAPYFIALAARRRGATMVHFSTDYVFDGRKGSPYVESDPVHPLNAYGRSKLCGDVLAAAAAARLYLARVSTVFGVAGAGRRENFVERVLAASRGGAPVRLMGDGAMSPTYAADAADAVAGLLRTRALFGIYHLANSGACSWFAFAEEIVRLSGGTQIAERAAAHESDARVQRPLNSALRSERLDALGLQTRSWQDGLRRYLRAMGRLTEA
jgi:dTDP-4-dehydrorhamnose reductase